MSVPSLQKIDSGFWYAFWSDGRRSKRKSMGTKDQAVAKARFAQWLLLDGQEAGEDVTYTVADLWKVYTTRHVEANVASQATHRFCWANLEPHFGHLELSQVSRAVETYTAGRLSGRIGGRKVKPSTIRRDLSLLRACLNWCADGSERKAIIPASSVPGFALPAESAPKDRWLRTEEIQRLLTAAGEMRVGPRLSRGERFLWLALETAGRKAAIMDLTWDRVDFETGVIHLADPDRRTTKKRRASVPISAALLPVLKRAHDERENELVMDNKGEIWATVQCIAYRAGFGTRGPVKTGTKPKATGISPHVLRHTAATHMARRGVPVWMIAKVLGNTIAMVERVYAKHSPDDLRGAVNMISQGALLEAAE
jgi:integrase